MRLKGLRLFCIVLTSDSAGIVDLNSSKEFKALILARK